MEDKKLKNLANIRGEDVPTLVNRFGSSNLDNLPTGFSKHLPALISSNCIDATGVEGDLAWVRLSDGMKFFSPKTHPALHRQYKFVADLLPDSVTEESFLAAIDVIQRYVTDFTWPPTELLKSSKDMNIIELGAYLGHKTIRFANELAINGGRVYAVEMMPENCEILRRNVIENGLQKVIEVLDIGVWHEKGIKIGYSKGRQRNSIVPIDKLEDGQRVELHTDTLDGIIGMTTCEIIDLIFMTVNGVETNALQGFTKIEKAKAFFIAAPYGGQSKEGSNAEICARMLRQKSYKILDVGNVNRVVGIR